nr:hypothetical protein [Ardenticatena sp.]
MSHEEQAHHTFIIRMWLESGETPYWRGRIEHIPSGLRQPVHSLDDISQFIRTILNLPDDHSVLEQP